jgi:hypothetical protein
MIPVEPPGGLPRVEREYYVMQSECYTKGRYHEEGLQPPRYKPHVGQGHAVVLLGQETVPISLRAPRSSPAPEATLERGARRDEQATTEN